MFGGKWMDTFMDKLAQKLNAQEMIKANSAADAEEMNQLKNQLREYDECLAQMQQVNKELRAVNHAMETLMSETIAPEEQNPVLACTCFLNGHKLLQELQQEYTTKLEEIRQNTEELEELRKHLDEKLDGSDENVHKECVKVYRNVQAAVVEENEKQTEAIAGKIKESLNGKLNGVLGVSIAALLVAAADIVLHVLSILHIF
jgi:DNA repair exonuclease SbcCD ATPase subunit